MITMDRTTSLVENHAALSGLLNTYGPASLAEFRAASLPVSSGRLANDQR